MEFNFVLQTLFEISVAAFIIYGLFFEEKFAETERKVAVFFKRLFIRTFSDNSSLTYHN